MTTPDPAMERPMYEYMCLGGPLEGQRVISRFADGFLLVEKSTTLVWIYDRSSQVADPSWSLRNGSPFVWDTVRSHAAAEGNTYDVIAYGAGEQTQ